MKAASPIRWDDEAHFIRTWLENPLTTGAVSPSGRSLSRMMARCVDPTIPGPIIELGPGTGPVTEALLRRGIAPERLLLVEFDAAFCRLLVRRYPGCRVVQGDAYALGKTLRNLLTQPAAAVVSSLPLLNRSERQRLSLLEDAFSLMRPEAPFVQFTYGLVSPIPRHTPARGPAFAAKGSAPVWLNLPPARVWVYRAEGDPAMGGREEEIDLLDRIKATSEKLSDELREQRDKLKAEFQMRSSEARAEFRARTQKVKNGLEKHSARLKAAREARATRIRTADKRQRW